MSRGSYLEGGRGTEVVPQRLSSVVLDPLQVTGPYFCLDSQSHQTPPIYVRRRSQGELVDVLELESGPVLRCKFKVFYVPTWTSSGEVRAPESKE